MAAREFAPYWRLKYELADEVNARLKRHIANRDRYIALLRDRLARAAEEVKEAKLDYIYVSAGLREELRTACQQDWDVLVAERARSARLRELLRQRAYQEDYRGIWVCRECGREVGHQDDCAIGLALAGGGGK